MKNDQIKIVLNNFRQMRLPVMAEEVLVMVENNELVSLSIYDVLERLSTNELTARKNSTINRLKKEAKLSQKQANINEIDYTPQRNLNRDVINQLSTNNYIEQHRNVILMGACGTGKSYLANALGSHACEAFYHSYYLRLFELLDECSRSSLEIDSVDSGNPLRLRDLGQYLSKAGKAKKAYCLA